MSSATSIDSGQRGAKAAATAPAAAEDPGLRPWQFFLLAGMLAATAGVIVATGQSAASIIILSLTVVSTSLVALGAYRSLSPLVLPDAVEIPAMIGGRTRAALEREKTLVLRSIKELEFDFAMGKIAQSDFDEMGNRLRARAIGLMRQLDTGSYASAIEQELETRIKKAGGAGRTRDGGQHSPGAAGLKSRTTGDAEGIDDLSIASPVASPVARDFSPASDGERAVEALASGVVCTCGTENDADARFCKGCGTRLSVVS